MKKLICIAVAFAALASPAQADPISAAAVWVASTFAVTAATATFIVNFAVSTALSAIGTALQKRRLGQQGANVNFDVQVGDDKPLSFVVGDYATAAKRKYIGSWGPNNRHITQVFEVSALPQDLFEFWVNDERAIVLFDQGEDMQHGQNVGYKLDNYNNNGFPRIWIRWMDGNQIAADPMLVSLFENNQPYPWTSAMVGRGKAYAIVTVCYDKDLLTSLPDFLFRPAPLPLYDWRFDSTAGGVGPQRWGQRSTYQPTRNPAVIAYNITRGIYYGDEWVYGGRNLPAWRLPVAEWTAAANACDQTVNLVGGGTQPRYRCGLEISVDMEPASVLEEIGKSANMKFAEVGGRLKPIVDLPGGAALAITDGDILITEGQSFNPFYPASETFNAISATYPEPGEKWASKDAPEYIDTDAQASDGGEYKPTTMQYGAVPYARQVQRLMRSQMRDFRRMRRHQFYLPPDAYALEPGIDLVSWTSNRNGYDNKLFMVESVSKTPGMNVLVVLREVDPGDYDWSSSFERPVIITPPINPAPFVQPINGLTVTGAVITDAAASARRAAILVACAGDESGVTRIQIEARRVGTAVSTIDTLRPFQEPFSWYLQNVLPSTNYEVKARLLSDLTPRSAWSGWLSVTTPDVRLGSEDIDVPAIRDEVIADLEELEIWVRGDDPIFQELEAEIDNARFDFENGLSDALALADANLKLARDYTDTGLQVEQAARVANMQAIAAQIQTLTAALTSDNMLDNPLFANGVIGWTGGTWATAQTRDPASADPIFAAAPTPFFARLVPGGSVRSFSQAFDITFAANEVFQWRLRATSAATGRTITVRTTWRNSSGATIGSAVNTTINLVQNEWRVFSGQITPPAGVASVLFEYRIPASGTEPTYIADTAATKVDQSAIARITDLEVAFADQTQAFAAFQQSAIARFEANEGAISTEALTRADQFGTLSGQISIVSAAASRSRTFYQAETPTGAARGDLWFKTDEGKRAYRANGDPLVWTPTDDLRIGQNTARIETEEIARANGDSALASQITTVDAKFGAAIRGGNLLLNGAFDTGDFTDWPTVEGVTIIPRDTGSSSNAVATAPTPFLLNFVATPDQQRQILGGAGAYVTGGERLNARVRLASGGVSPNVTFVIGIAFRNAAGNQVGFQSRNVTITSSIWQNPVIAPFVAPLDAVVVQYVFLRRAAGSVGAGFAADIRLERESGFDALTAASVETVAQASSDADNALAQLIQTVTARTDRGTATGRFRVSSQSTPSGVRALVGLHAEATDGLTQNSAGIFLQADTSGFGQAIIAADRFSVVTGQDANGPVGTRRAPFIVRGNNVFMANAIVDTLAIGPNQVTVPASQTLASPLVGIGTNVWQTCNQISYTLPFAGAVTISWFGAHGYEPPYANNGMGLRLVINGTVEWERGALLANDWPSMAWKRSLSAGTHTIRIDWRATTSALSLFSRTVIIDGAMR